MNLLLNFENDCIIYLFTRLSVECTTIDLKMQILSNCRKVKTEIISFSWEIDDIWINLPRNNIWIGSKLYVPSLHEILAIRFIRVSDRISTICVNLIPIRVERQVEIVDCREFISRLCRTVISDHLSIRLLFLARNRVNHRFIFGARGKIIYSTVIYSTILTI